MISSQLRTQQKQQQQGISFFSSEDNTLIFKQEDLNKTKLNLDANRFNYSKLSKEEASIINNLSIDIYLENKFGAKKYTKQRIDHTKIQDLVLKKIEPLLKQKKIVDYDQKILLLAKEYEKIVTQLNQKSFILKLPLNYQPQLQDFNEFYSVDNSRKTSYSPLIQIEEQIADQLVKEFEEKIDQEKENNEDQWTQYDDDDRDNDDENFMQGKGPYKYKPSGFKEYEGRFDTEQQEQEQEQQQVQQKKPTKKQPKKKKPVVEEEQVQQHYQMQIIEQEQEEIQEDEEEAKLEQQRKYEKQLEQLQQSIRQKKQAIQREQSALEEYLVTRRPSSPRTPRTPVQDKPEEDKPPIQKRKTTVQKPRQPSQFIVAIVPQQQKQEQPQVAQIGRQATIKSEQTPKRSDEIAKPFQQEEPDDEDEEIESENEQSQQQQKAQSKQQSPLKKPILSQKSQEIQAQLEQEDEPIVEGEEEQGEQDVEEEESPLKVKKRITEVKYQKQISRKASQQEQIKLQEEDDEIDEEKETQTQQEIPNKKSSEASVQTPRSLKQNTIQLKKGPQKKKSINKMSSQQITDDQQQQQDQYLSLAKKRQIGTGLIDQIVKNQNLLDFDVQPYEKQYNYPEYNKTIQFDTEEEKFTFEKMFKWQFQIETNIIELEKALNAKKKQEEEEFKRDDSDDDEDPNNYNEKSSINTSDITDFGPVRDEDFDQKQDENNNKERNSIGKQEFENKLHNQQSDDYD